MGVFSLYPLPPSLVSDKLRPWLKVWFNYFRNTVGRERTTSLSTQISQHFQLDLEVGRMACGWTMIYTEVGHRNVTHMITILSHNPTTSSSMLSNCGHSLLVFEHLSIHVHLNNSIFMMLMSLRYPWTISSHVHLVSKT